MPITTYTPPADGGFATNLDRLTRQQRDVLMYGEALEPAAKPEAPGLIKTLGARAGMSLVGSAAYALNRPTGETDDFNPFTFIRENPALADDPRMPQMIERGVFDATFSERQFWYDLQAANQFFDDAETVHRAGTLVGAATFAAEMVGDPTNLIPLGLGAKAIRSGGALVRAAKTGAVVGSAGLAFKKTQDAITPVTNEPGMTDELLTFGMGAGLGAVLSVITSPAVRGAVDGYMPPKKMQQLRDDLADLQNETFDSSVRASMDDTQVPAPTPVAHKEPVIVSDAADARAVTPVEAEPAPATKPASPAPVAPATSRAQPFSKADIERRLEHAYERSSFAAEETGDFERAMSDISFGDGSGLLSFPGDLPTEIAEHLENYPPKRKGAIRKLFRTNVDRGQGQDYFESIPWDQYVKLLDQAVDGSVKAGRHRRIAEKLGGDPTDPQFQFLAAVYNNIPEGRTPRKEVYTPGDLPVGATFELNGERFHVVEHEDGYRVLKDGDTYPEVPLEALDEVPVDKGTMTIAEPSEVPDFAADVGAKHNAVLGLDDQAVADAEAIWGADIRSVEGRGSPVPPKKQARDLFGNPTADALAGKQGEIVFETERQPAPDVSGRGPAEKAVEARGQLDGATAKLFGEGPAGAMGAAARADITPVKVTLAQEYDTGLQWLVRLLRRDPSPHRVVSVLNRRGDVAADLLAQLRAKHDEAGVPLQVVDHPNQYHYDLEQDLAALLESSDMNIEAVPADFDYGWSDTAMSRVSTRYAKLQAVVNPAGRILNQSLGRFHDIIRTLSGSAQTVTKGSARDPFGFRAGASAEGIKGVLEGPKDAAVLSLRGVYSGIRRTGQPIEFNGVVIKGRFDYDKFRRAVNDYYRMESAKEAGFPVVIPPVSDAIRKGADAVRPYFHKMRDHGVESGLLPQAVSKRAWYLPRAYDVEELVRRPQEFIERLTKAFRKRDLHAEGRILQPSEVPLRPEVAEKLDQTELLKLVGTKKGENQQLDQSGPGLGNDAQPTITPEQIAKLNESDLPVTIFRAYEEELRAFYRRNAQVVWERLTNTEDRHGIADALESRATNDPAKARVMDIDEWDFADYLLNDPEILLERYHHVMAGRIAVRKALKLNSDVWSGVTLKDGTPIDNGAALKQYLLETTNTLTKFAAFQDERGKIATNSPKARKLASRVLRDIADPLDMLEGRDPMGHDPRYGFWRWTGRSLLKLSYLNKLGGMFWASLSDMAPLTMYMVQRPQTLAILPKIMRGLKGMSRREMEALGLGMDALTRSRAIFDTDSLYGRLGTGDGVMRQVTGAAEAGLDKLVDAQGTVTMMHFWTRALQQQSGFMAMDRLTDHSKRLLRADAAMKKGAGKTKALRDAGLSSYDAARVNKLGLNAERAKLYHEQVYKHGLLGDDKPVRDAMTFDEYMESKRFVKPNVPDWDPPAHQLRDIVAANLHAEVTRHMVVQPGVFDRPLINMTVLGKLFNQFQTFGMAFANQRLRPMAQMPAKYQLWYYMNYLAMGAVADAISNHLSGRRDLDETAKLWGDNPQGMVYAAFDRSGMAGWWGRPLSVMDAMGLPYSPGALVGRVPESTANRHIQPGRILTALGPSFADLDALGSIMFDTAGGRADRNTAYKSWKLAPFQNNMWLRLLHKTTGAPVVPEAIRPKKPRDTTPTP